MVDLKGKGTINLPSRSKDGGSPSELALKCSCNTVQLFILASRFISCEVKSELYKNMLVEVKLGLCKKLLCVQCLFGHNCQVGKKKFCNLMCPMQCNIMGR